MQKSFLTVTAIISLTALSACGQGAESEPAAEADSAAASTELANGMTVKDQIEARQGQLKKVGKAFKTISDNLKSDAPDVAAMQAAAASIPAATEGMADWFPDGTGPDSGVETDALAIIWEEKEDFLTKVSDMQTAAANLSTIAEGGDVAAIGEAFKATGGTCKSCHDKYRLDD